MSNEDVFIRDATVEDIDIIVNIHLAAFQGFFLSILGASFLKILYQGFLKNESGILRVAARRHDNKIIGFSAGSTHPELFFKKLRRQCWYKFFLAALAPLLKNPRLIFTKLFNAIFYKGDIPERISNASLLSSIAVLPCAAGTGCGSLLINDFEQESQILGSSCVFLTTDALQNDHVIHFYHSKGYVIESTFNQNGGRVMYRFLKNIT